MDTIVTPTKQFKFNNLKLMANEYMYENSIYIQFKPEKILL